MEELQFEEEKYIKRKLRPSLTNISSTVFKTQHKTLPKPHNLALPISVSFLANNYWPDWIKLLYASMSEILKRDTCLFQISYYFIILHDCVWLLRWVPYCLNHLQPHWLKTCLGPSCSDFAFLSTQISFGLLLGLESCIGPFTQYSAQQNSDKESILR